MPTCLEFCIFIHLMLCVSTVFAAERFETDDRILLFGEDCRQGVLRPLSCNKVTRHSCLSDVASCSTLDESSSRATKLLDRNHFYSSAISHSVAEL